MKTAILLIGVLLGALLTGGFTKRLNQDRPWMQPAQPTQLEWLALEKQATEGENDFGEDGLTINFYLGPDSFQTGVIYCDVAYRPDVPAAVLELAESSIQHRFDMEREEHPWARVKIITKAAP